MGVYIDLYCLMQMVDDRMDAYTGQTLLYQGEWLTIKWLLMGLPAVVADPTAPTMPDTPQTSKTTSSAASPPTSDDADSATLPLWPET